MPKIKVLVHQKYCEKGALFEAATGENLLKALLENGVSVPHACEFQGACGACHVYLRQGASSVNPMSDREDEVLDKVFAIDMDSRLACQVVIGHEDLVIEIPN